MATFKKTVDIWAMTAEQIAALQPGQWVKAGPDGPSGRFFGHGASTVVAWSRRLPKGKRYFEYLKRYAQFGREARERKSA